MGTWVRGWFLLTLLLAGCTSEGDQPTQSHEAGMDVPASNGGGRIVDHLPGNVTMTILDVAPGSAILVQAPGVTLLFDTGTDSAPSRQHLQDALQARDIRRLDYLAISHPGADRTGGCGAVLHGFLVDRVLQPASNGTSPVWKACQQAIASAGVQVLDSLKAGQVLRAGDQLTIEILGVDATSSPPADGGLAVRIAYGGFSAVLVGDRSCAAQQDLLAAGAHPRAEVLELPLHGSSQAECPGWLDATSPQYAFFSADGKGPAPGLENELDRRGVDLLRPGRGDITITSDGNGIRVTA